jgi:hypothetical protein
VLIGALDQFIVVLNLRIDKTNFETTLSLVVSNKAESAKHQYNLRVVETLGAARVLSNYLNLEVDSDSEKTKRRLVTLREVLARKENFYRDEQDAQQEDLTQLRKGLEDVLKGNILDCLLPKVEGRTGVTLDEMISMSGMDKTEFMEVYLSWVDGECLCSCQRHCQFFPTLCVYL